MMAGFPERGIHSKSPPIREWPHHYIVVLRKRAVGSWNAPIQNDRLLIRQLYSSCQAA